MNNPCYICHVRPARCRDHEGSPGPGKIRGMLCIACNIALGTVERVGIESIQAYLEASPIGPIKSGRLKDRGNFVMGTPEFRERNNAYMRDYKAKRKAQDPTWDSRSLYSGAV